MTERWKAKKNSRLPVPVGTQGKVLTVGQRLEIIEIQIGKIREQLA
jgi:hypothetical protein